ncbi:MAG: universal stress protein, partial [Noviherbaspirillum sp.]
RDEPSPALLPGFPEYVVMSSGTPALLVPYAMTSPPEAGTILVAWNASAEAMRAVRGALPLLARAEMVHVAVYNAAARREAHGEQPGADLALYLARHGIAVQVQERDTDIKCQASDAEIMDALLSLTADLDGEMLVMGCYGHSRFREILLGGATRAILQSMTVPVLMAH